MSPQAWQCASSHSKGQHYSKVTSAPGDGKITIHTSLPVTPAVGWGQTTGLTAGPAHQEKLLREQQKESALQFGVTETLVNAWSD